MPDEKGSLTSALIEPFSPYATGKPESGTRVRSGIFSSLNAMATSLIPISSADPILSRKSFLLFHPDSNRYLKAKRTAMAAPLLSVVPLPTRCPSFSYNSKGSLSQSPSAGTTSPWHATAMLCRPSVPLIFPSAKTSFIRRVLSPAFSISLFMKRSISRFSLPKGSPSFPGEATLLYAT